jgi:hypothetical protein
MSRVDVPTGEPRDSGALLYALDKKQHIAQIAATLMSAIGSPDQGMEYDLINVGYTVKLARLIIEEAEKDPT